MSMLLDLNQVLGKWTQETRPGFIRQHRCRLCSQKGLDIVLAAQLTDKIEQTDAADYYVVDSGFMVKGEPYLLYRKEKWFGNIVKCPVCGSTGKLPIDEPLSYDLMKESREGRNDNRN